MTVGIQEGWNGGKTGGSAMQFDGERLGQLVGYPLSYPTS